MVQPLKISKQVLEKLEDNLCLFFTKFCNEVRLNFKETKCPNKKTNKKIIENLMFNKELGMKSKKLLENGKLEDFAKFLTNNGDVNLKDHIKQ